MGRSQSLADGQSVDTAFGLEGQVLIPTRKLDSEGFSIIPFDIVPNCFPERRVPLIQTIAELNVLLLAFHASLENGSQCPEGTDE